MVDVVWKHVWSMRWRNGYCITPLRVGVRPDALLMMQVISTNLMKMSRRPTILEHFSILDVHYNLNFLGVDVKGGCSFIFGASYLHPFVSISFCLSIH